MKQAKPTTDEIDSVTAFLSWVDLSCDDIANDQSVAAEVKARYRAIAPLWRRVIFGGQCAIENACDPDLNYCEFKPEILDGKAAADFWREQAAWSNATFGTEQERGPIGALKHLKLEVNEALEAETEEERRKEIVDCQFLVQDAARRSGMSMRQFFTMCLEKLEINKKRKYPKPTSDEPSLHEKTP